MRRITTFLKIGYILILLLALVQFLFFQGEIESIKDGYHEGRSGKPFGHKLYDIKLEPLVRDTIRIRNSAVSDSIFIIPQNIVDVYVFGKKQNNKHWGWMIFFKHLHSLASSSYRFCFL